MLAAESLVAENGFGSVSVRMVIGRARIKNTSAINYHFGSFEEMYQALVRYRMDQLDTIRARRMQQLDRAQNLNEIVNLICQPHQEIRTENGYPYASFLAEYLPLKYPTGFPWIMKTPEKESDLVPLNPPALTRLLSSLRDCLPNVQPEILDRRIANGTLLFLNVLRSISREIESEDQEAINDALRQFVAILMAPTTDA